MIQVFERLLRQPQGIRRRRQRFSHHVLVRPVFIHFPLACPYRAVEKLHICTADHRTVRFRTQPLPSNDWCHRFLHTVSAIIRCVVDAGDEYATA